MRALALFVAAHLLLGWVGAARADGLVDVDDELARQHFITGKTRYEAEDWSGALLEFNEARKLRALPALDFNIARCLDRLQRWSESADAYQRFCERGRSARVGATRSVSRVR